MLQPRYMLEEAVIIEKFSIIKEGSALHQNKWKGTLRPRSHPFKLLNSESLGCFLHLENN